MISKYRFYTSNSLMAALAVFWLSASCVRSNYASQMQNPNTESKSNENNTSADGAEQEDLAKEMEAMRVSPPTASTPTNTPEMDVAEDGDAKATDPEITRHQFKASLERVGGNPEDSRGQRFVEQAMATQESLNKQVASQLAPVVKHLQENRREEAQKTFTSALTNLSSPMGMSILLPPTLERFIISQKDKNVQKALAAFYNTDSRPLALARTMLRDPSLSWSPEAGVGRYK